MKRFILFILIALSVAGCNKWQGPEVEQKCIITSKPSELIPCNIRERLEGIYSIRWNGGFINEYATDAWEYDGGNCWTAKDKTSQICVIFQNQKTTD